MLENKKKKSLHTQKLSNALYMYNCYSINFPMCKENCYRLPTHMTTAAWKNDPVEKLCNQHVKSMAWDKENSKSREGIPYTGMTL